MSLATTPGIWLSRWLLFRFMFMSGVVKLLSGDPNWRCSDQSIGRSVKFRFPDHEMERPKQRRIT